MKAALEGLNGVKKADVSFNKEEAVVHFEEGKTDVKEMIQAVSKAGYRSHLLFHTGPRCWAWVNWLCGFHTISRLFPFPPSRALSDPYSLRVAEAEEERLMEVQFN